MIELGERIRALRLRDGRTQESFGQALGVTAQAVSRWEKGICYPDMEMIPSMANFFGVSIDELFGYDGDRSGKVDALAARIDEMNRQNNGVDVSMDGCIALAREALIEFPGNEKLTLALAEALFNAGYVRRGEHHVVGEDGFSRYDTARHRAYPEWQEAVKLYEKLLLSLPEGEMRQRAVLSLAQLYKNLGEGEKALILAENAPDITASRPFLRIKAFDGPEAVAACGEALLETVNESADLTVKIVLSDATLPPDTAAQLLENAAGLFALICTDGWYGRHEGLLACLHMLRSYYLWLAGEKDGAFAALDDALASAKRLDELGKGGQEYYAAPLLRRVRTQADKVPPDSAFHRELPDLWPWWDVPKGEEVKAQMAADPRWSQWTAKTKE